jgi:hypothetical protein
MSVSDMLLCTVFECMYTKLFIEPESIDVDFYNGTLLVMFWKS